MRLVLVVVALCAASIAFAQSQPPSPGSGILEGGKPQTATASANQQPATDPRGTNESPLIIKVQPTPKTDAEAAREQQKEDDEASSKRWTIGLAVVTAVVGVLQLFLLGKQAKIASKQNEIGDNQTTILRGQAASMSSSDDVAKRQLDIAEEQAAIAREQSAISKRQNEIIDSQTTLMASGLVETRKAAEASTKSADAAYKALIMTHPPRLTVRAITSAECDRMAASSKLHGREMNAFDALRSAFAQSATTIAPKLRVVNEGRSEAIPYSSDCHVYTTASAPTINSCDETLHVLSIPKLGAGHAVMVDLPTVDVSAEDMARIVIGRLELYVVGVIVYTDELGSISRTGFSQVFHREKGHFVPCPYPPGQDWNYQT
jgi:hypothetical protein